MARSDDKGHRVLRRGRASLPGQIYNVTATTLRRQRFFADFRAACAASASFAPCVTGDSRLLCWVLMPDHAHWLLQSGQNDSLDVVIARIKATSARAANALLGRTGALWSRAYHDHALRKEEDVVTVARYIVGIPVRAGLVDRIGGYPFWNAVWVAPEGAPTEADLLM
ncbi:MAG: REP-associated tyrosine transposase [Sinimarinibacterium flocculans]|uniref:REP-associated tyrosine transposase n=1 Tax=Sinimarinibacterium flocculans TaxID=985250 RepID=UPI003C660D5B